MKMYNGLFIAGIFLIFVSLLIGLKEYINGEGDILFFIYASFALWVILVYFLYQMMREENKNE